MLSVIRIVMATHIVLLAAVAFFARRHRRTLGVGGLLFCALVPLFGPICGLEMVLAEAPDPELLRDMIMSQERLRKSYVAPGAEAATTAPMEEAFFISAPNVRREMMMKLLNDDPARNIELLMMARFNDDPETAHYATATLTAYQRRTEMALQQSQALLSKWPDDVEERMNYIHQMETYIDSGLLEGHLLGRQRTLLEKELSRLDAEHMDVELGCLRVRNLLELKRAPEAIDMARWLIVRFPGREEPWLALMRVYVECRDAQGLEGLRNEMEQAGVQWSYGGREKMEYFLKGVA